jgi:N-hydroxyarylamine O-acetyltransferase
LEGFGVDTTAYLKRINYDGPLDPTAETLRDLQVAHLLAVPFENLSIHSGESILLDDDSLFQKIVERRRGGFCYELNGLFAALLRDIGFQVEMLSARVANQAEEFGPEFDHMTLMVTLAKRWLVDVGFGDSFREPLLLDERAEQPQGERAYRIYSAGDHFTLMQRDEPGTWRAQYRFTLQPHVYTDYAGMCHYHQTSPESHFTQRRICSLATTDGRITLGGLRLITTRGNERTERELTGEAAYAEALRTHFGIVMSG